MPTLLRVSCGAVVDVIGGWSRERWEQVSGVRGLGLELPDEGWLKLALGRPGAVWRARAAAREARPLIGDTAGHERA